MKLAKSLRSGMLTGIYIPSIVEQEDRSLLRVRRQIVRDVSRCKNRIKSHLYFQGVVIPEEFMRSKGYWKKSFKAWLMGHELDTPSGCEALQQQLHTLFSLEDRLKSVNTAIRSLARTERFAKRMELITSIPGIAEISGMIILAEIGNVKRFKRVDQLNSFAGFIPNVYASGDKERVGELTKRGNNNLRTTIIECSWWAIKKDPALAMAYEKLCLRMKPSKAIIRIARKLLARLRQVLISEKPYVYGVIA